MMQVRVKSLGTDVMGPRSGLQGVAVLSLRRWASASAGFGDLGARRGRFYPSLTMQRQPHTATECPYCVATARRYLRVGRACANGLIAAAGVSVAATLLLAAPDL